MHFFSVLLSLATVAIVSQANPVELGRRAGEFCHCQSQDSTSHRSSRTITAGISPQRNETQADRDAFLGAEDKSEWGFRRDYNGISNSGEVTSGGVKKIVLDSV
ncbi:hypothetical protein EVG20_g6977 [Dentipellis fragilis]|uniref:Uncharacterized protein n=1 Tax=Dentipellis fragilis TaxID=205917 RepID=A0A4Y9YJK9_9AGAM|nr:hypothetical protein EVG20_g6977 [Dentipellis fragilis]